MAQLFRRLVYGSIIIIIIIIMFSCSN